MLVCNAASPAGATSASQKNHSQEYLNTTNNSRYRKQTNTAKPKPESFSLSSPQLYIHKPHHLAAAHPSALDDQTPPPIPPLPLNYQRSDGLFFSFYVCIYRPPIFPVPTHWIFIQAETLRPDLIPFPISQMRATLTRHESIRSNVPYRRLHDKLSSSDCESLKRFSGNRRRSRCNWRIWRHAACLLRRPCEARRRILKSEC